MRTNAFVSVCLIFLVSFLPTTKGQEARPNIPNGFHLGLKCEENLSGGASVVPTIGNLPAPQSLPAFGNKIGIEVSYYFLRYFGVSLGVGFGDNFQFKLKNNYKDSNLSKYNFKWYIHSFDGIEIPLKFEFNYPFLHNNWSVYCALGINISNIYASTLDIYEIILGTSDDPIRGYMKESVKIEINPILNIGVAYRLPYNDLIRASVVTNMAFKDRISGIYMYQDNYSGGTLNYKHNTIGLEVSYVHCF